MGWHIYCMLSGISAGNGPRQFMNKWEVTKLASGLSTKITQAQQLNDVLPPHEEMEAILVDALTRLSERAVPDSMKTWCKEVAVVKDLDFEDDSDVESSSSHTTANSDGSNFVIGSDRCGEKLRFCSHFDESTACFEKVLSYSGNWIEEVTGIMSTSGEGGSAVFVDRRCWYYLHAWLSIPPRSGILITHGLEWDILHVVRSSLKASTEQVCIHPDLDYGPLLQGCWPQYQDFVIEDATVALKTCLKDVPNVRQALSGGLREKNLEPALLRDLQTWVFERPDRWPRHSDNSITPKFQAFTTSDIPTLMSLPLRNDLAHLSSASKSMRQLMSQSSLLSAILRGMVNHGSLRWIQPCSDAPGEVDAAYEALVTWIDYDACKDLLNNANFPFVSFVYACTMTSDSMKSRFRLWKIVKQLEPAWTAYRNEDNARNCMVI
ncbi:hypothetical protein DL96DRAFT_1590439 [Flagelloscypha sp. PMI_526]|nr:hypothetical protein DL96DRAFT_1590439 [Flagelloscypha sp. PMI_526]